MLPLKDEQKGLCPFMGFHEEQCIPSFHTTKGGDWVAFYTAIIKDGQRVYVWAWKELAEAECCVMVSDVLNTYKASVAEIQNMFADQHTRNKTHKYVRTYKRPSDPFLLQAFLHEITRGGNNNQLNGDTK